MAPFGRKFNFDGVNPTGDADPSPGPGDDADNVYEFKREQWKPGQSEQPKSTETGGRRWIGGAPLAMPAWLVKGVLPETGVALLGGQYSAGKTFIAIDFALSIALGVPFAGRKVEPGGVLFIAAEGGGELETRVFAACAHKFDAAERYEAADLPFQWDESPPVLNSDVGRKWLGEQCRGADKDFREHFDVPLRLVIIDTLAAAFGIQDENDNAEASKIMRWLTDFGRELGVIVMPIAHLGKAAEVGIRGASAFAAGADAILGVLTEGADRNRGIIGARSLHVSKLRRGSTGPLSGFRLAPVLLGEDKDGDLVTSCVVEFHKAQDGPEAEAIKMTAPLRAFLDALDDALISAGRSHRSFGDGPEVRAADVTKDVRVAFTRRYVSGAADAKEKTSAERTAWSRALSDARKAKALVGLENKGGIELAWRI